MNPVVERFIGLMLRPVRAGERRVACRDPRIAAAPETIRLISTNFNPGGPIPPRHAAEPIGSNMSPELHWTNVPTGTEELVLIIQDPDAPLVWPVVHLSVYGLKPSAGGAPEGSFSGGEHHDFGMGSFRRIGYQGPQPIRLHGKHRYVFQLIALSEHLSVPSRPSLSRLLYSMAGKVIGRGQLVGTFEQR